MKTYRIQEIVFAPYASEVGTEKMYYRSDAPIFMGPDGTRMLLKRSFYDFSTYFSSLSVGKYKRYTIASDFALNIEAQGSFEIDLMGHYVNKLDQIKKEWLGKYKFNLKERTLITLPVPHCNSEVISFQIFTKSKVVLYDGFYSALADENRINDPRIVLVTTTYKKESYVYNNLELLKDTVFKDSELRDHFKWKIIDNGRTLDPHTVGDDRIRIIPNKNVGGAGGFTRGIIEALKENDRPSNILLMDDDVIFYPESFRRVYMLLLLQKKEYRDYFISGAMLEISEKNIQHEDVGLFNLLGEHGPAKPRYDLCLWDSVILNEKYLPEDSHQYSGWWFCCIPTTVAREDNLPLPFFIRGDDVEYSIRNNAKFITMNGICIWHEGFGTKFSAAMELYQVHRNDLILQSMTPVLQDVDVVKRMKDLFWQEIYKFNYKGADLICDAFEDYLKGPEYFKNIDGEQCMKDKKSKDNALVPFDPEVEQMLNACEWNITAPMDMDGLEKFVYDYSLNGHRLPGFIMSETKALIPYGWGYYPSRMRLCKEIYAVDTSNRIYIKYSIDKKKYREVVNRFKELERRLDSEGESCSEKYREAAEELESSLFWNEYLQRD